MTYSVKEIYYTLQGGRLRFASEIKALLADPSMPRELNVQGLFDFVGYEFTPAPETLFQGVKKLMPGHTLVLEADGTVKISRYWSLSEKEVDPSPEALIGLLEQVSSAHMLSDVPVGSFLSGFRATGGAA